MSSSPSRQTASSNEEPLGAGRLRKRRRSKDELDDSDPEEESSHSETESDEDLLEEIFWDLCLQRNGNDDGVLETIVETLRRSPGLASRHFDHRPYSAMSAVPVNPHTTSHTGFRLLPFTYLLIAGASLEVLKEILKMSEDLDYDETMPDGNSYPMIHTACLHRSQETELIQLIASLKPESLLYQTFTVSLPIHIALSKYAPLETLQVLLDLCPKNDILTTWDLHTDMDCLQRALWYQSPVTDPRIVDLFVTGLMTRSGLWDAYSKRNRYIFRGQQNRLTRVVAEILLRLLPHCERFDCIPGDWDFDAWTMFLDQFPQRTMVTIELCLDLPWDVVDCRSACQALTGFLGNSNTSLQTLTFVNEFSKEGSQQTSAPFIQAIANGLASNSSLDKLIFTKFPLAANADLSNLFLMPRALKQLEFRHVDFSALSWPPSTTTSLCFSSIEEVTFWWSQLTTEYLGQLLLLLAKMPRLKLLDLSTASTGNSTLLRWNKLTERLAHLVSQNRLQRLELGGASDGTMDLTSFSNALKENTSLESLVMPPIPFTNVATLLDTLRHHNTTLATIQVSNEMETQSDVAEIRYWALLNAHGRRQVRNAKLSLSTFVDLLDTANHASYDRTMQQKDVLYGLLRECPGIWYNVFGSQLTTSRKRKRY